MDRIARIREMFHASGLGLEIGPSFNPIVPKSEGFNVEILDYADKDGLLKKYSGSDVDISAIESVDYVSDGRSMLEVIGQKARYDYIVASHVIEHAPDLAGFVSDCAELLKPDGVLVLAVPDKRFCFDALRPLSSLGQVLQAYAENRTRHALSSVFDHQSLFCKRSGVVGWGKSDTGTISFEYDLAYAKKMFDNAAVSGGYVDVHGWVFTPSSFRYIMKGLHDLRLIPLREGDFQESEYFEFFLTFGRDCGGCSVSYLELAERTTAELRSIHVRDQEGETPEIEILQRENVRLHRKIAHLKKYRDRRLKARLSRLYSRFGLDRS